MIRRADQENLFDYEQVLIELSRSYVFLLEHHDASEEIIELAKKMQKNTSNIINERREIDGIE